MSRIVDPELLRQLHREWQECLICHGTAYSEGRLSLHHVHSSPRNDVRGNLVMLCGDGVRGCHGKITLNDEATLHELGLRIKDERPDVILYLVAHLGDDQAEDWLRRKYAVSL
jgi:hypothetical protein